MKKFLKSPFIRYLLLCMLAVLVGVNLFSLNASHLAGNAVPMPFGIGASVVLSGSMEPTLSPGDLLIIREQAHYETGDIVVFQNGIMPVVHRIVSISDETVTTCGDANNTNDEPFPVGNVKGEVVAVIPLVGYAVWVLKKPAAIVIMLAMAVFLVEWSFLAEKKEKQRRQQELKDQIRALMEELDEH